MNPVSLTGIIRYLLANKKIVLVLLIAPIIIFSAWGFFSWKQLEDVETPPEEIQTKPRVTVVELEDKLNSELPEDKKEKLFREFPQLVGEKLYHHQEKFFITTSDPNRTENMNQFFIEFFDLTKAHLNEFNSLANEKFDLFQLNLMVKIISRPDDKVLYIRGYGPTEEAADYLFSVLIQQFFEHAKELPIETTIIPLGTESGLYTKKPFLEAAIERFIETDKPEKPVENADSEEEKEVISLPQQMIKYSAMGLILGLVMSFLVMIFGSSSSNRYFSLREWVVSGYPVVGAYQRETKSTLSLDDKLFAQSLLLKENDAIEQAIFKMIPTLRSDSKALVFFYDEHVPNKLWKEKFLEYDLQVEEIPLRISPDVFKSLINNGKAFILVSKENFLKTSSILYPNLTEDSVIVIAI